MQISHVVLNYFFISYIIVVFLFILHNDWDEKKSYCLCSFKRFGLCQEKEVLGSREVSKQFWSFLKSPGCKVSFNFLYFPHKAEFMSGSQEILMFND